MIDISNLKEKLEGLKGIDFEQCETEERLAGNNAVDVSTSKSFQARLAARALGVNPFDIRELPLKEYSKITMEVLVFLFSGSAEGSTPSKN